MMRLLKQLKTLWELSKAEVTTNFANDVRLKAPQSEAPREKKLAQILDFRANPLADIPKDDEISSS